MPYSHPVHADRLLRSLVERTAPSTILDVGAGAGRLGALCRLAAPAARIVAIEIWAAYPQQMPETYGRAYDEVWVADYHAWRCEHHDVFDLILFGDVLEHWPLDVALGALREAARRHRWVYAAWPVGYAQGEVCGNPHEAHLSTITMADLAGLDVVDHDEEAMERDNRVFVKHAVAIRGTAIAHEEGNGGTGR